MYQHSPAKLGDLLLQRHWISQQILDQALDNQKQSGTPLGQILVESAQLSTRQLSRALKWQACLRMAMLASSFSLCSQAAVATDIYLASATSAQLAPDQKGEMGATLGPGQSFNSAVNENSLAGFVKNSFGEPVWTLLRGRYSAGVDRVTEGMRYQAKWSQKSFKLEARYQF